MASSWSKRHDKLAFTTANSLLFIRHLHRIGNSSRLSSMDTTSRCIITTTTILMGSEAADTMAVQLAKSRRFRRSGDTASARKALNLVKRTDRVSSEEYILEDANVRASELLITKSSPQILLKGASAMLDTFDRVRSNSSPSAIAAALRVVRTAAESDPALSDHSRLLVNRAFDLLLLSQPSLNGDDDIREVNIAMQSLINVCATIGDPDTADYFLNTVQRKYAIYEPCANVRASLLLANIVAGRVDEATKISADIEVRGEAVPPTTIASLASVYADAGRHVLAVSALDEALSRYGALAVSKNHTLLAAVLRSCERARDARAARRVYDALIECDAKPPAYIVLALLRAAFKGGEALLAEAILLDGRNTIAAKYRLGPDDMNRMVAAASRIPTLPPRKKAIEAMRLFERTMEFRAVDLGAFNILVAALARVGALPDAKYIVQHKMKEHNIVPNIVTFNTLLHACVVASRPYIALEIWRGMMGDFVAPNQVTYNTLVNLAAECGARELLDAVLHEMRCNPTVELDPTTVAAILKFYRRVRDPDGARQVVGILQRAQRQREIDMPSRNNPQARYYLPLDPVVYVSLLTIYVECDRPSEAITLFGLLVVRRIGGSRPYNVMMHYYGAKKRDAKRALRILAAMKRRGVAPDASSYTIAIRAAAGAHRLSLAQRLLAEMQDVGAAAADTYAWTAVIAACGSAGRPHEALALLAKMRQGAAGAPRPDIAAYNAAIYAVGMASRAGWRASLMLYGVAKEDENANLDDVTYSALASVALRHRHRVREEGVVREIERALHRRLARLRKENEARANSSPRYHPPHTRGRPARKSPGTGEAKKLAGKLKRIRWLITNMHNNNNQRNGARVANDHHRKTAQKTVGDKT